MLLTGQHRKHAYFIPKGLNMNKAYLNIQYLDEHNVCYNLITIFNLSINNIVISVVLLIYADLTKSHLI